ncbi:TPA: hypothetical protein ACNYHX_000572 [Streptococcus pyogenes]|uniref:hypothetical protein n=1 Tax=Streptococcus pyogenes TaxID=1314 RepID=UPI000252E5C0|nr:hypothetical protein [Streptococcus pyogenes]HER4563434.1 hypothetical protein [Streptococcus pyogenes NGAS639]HER4697939.1 hypothetical protein [Streptococcus pyogenes NGAS339]HER4708090.1 hypothetical protein [Streptococcus pyogenes NGAS321]AFC65737.1 hypothetical protein MGAS15252_0384 [Streptococcus pyogenes MGAS15252]AFC67606.1 hypothetical protein MGAS1882_0381 [Streptococcus pyogenes MGAS1882]
MKEKSKRFLNLGSLLTSLGVTLLMVQPVKAEVISEDSSGLTNYTEEQNNPWGHQNSFGFISEKSNNWGESVNSYDKGRVDGYNDGYKRGKEKDAPREFTEPIPSPSNGDYTNPTDIQWYEQGYKDTFKTGYYEGWATNHWIQATLEWLWTTITSWFLGTSS